MSNQREGGKSKVGRQHVHNQAHYERQFKKTRLNKEKAWDEHLANHPNDLQAKQRIDELWRA